jgi:hypothetical protein
MLGHRRRRLPYLGIDSSVSILVRGRGMDVEMVLVAVRTHGWASVLSLEKSVGDKDNSVVAETIR